MLLCQWTQHKTHLNYHLVTAELPFIPKVIYCMHQTIKTYLQREHSILLSVTRMLYVYQVCHGVSRCVKDESCSLSSLEWKLIDCVNGISYNLNKCEMLSNTSQITFFSFRKTAHWSICIVCATHSNCCGAVDLLSPEPWPQQPRALITRFRESYSSVSTSPESKRLKKSRRNELNSGNALMQHLSEKCDFRVFLFCQVVQKHKLFGVA